MAWIKRTAATYRTLLEDITNFAIKATKAETAVAGANTGDGALISQSSTQDSVLETITVTCTTGGASAVFSVVGSATGALPSANTNETYSDSVISFVISGGDADFVIGDSFTVAISAESAKWSVNRLINTPGSEYEAQLQGVGYSGVDEIFVGMQSWENGVPKGIRVSGFTGYQPSLDFLDQPGATQQGGIIRDYCVAPCVEDTIVYWLHVSPQSISCNMLSGAVYVPFYIGWINQYAAPSQFIYPIAVGYSSNSLSYSYTSNYLSSFWVSTAHAGILDTTGWKGGTGSGIDYLIIEPTTYGGRMADILANEDGSIVHFPAVVTSDSTVDEAVYGEFEGVSIPATDQETLTVEDLILETTTSYVTMQDTNKTGTLALFELKGDQ